jgi:glutamine amidotransferase
MTAPVVGILKMPIGNLQSAWNALYALGFDPVMVEEAAQLDDVTHLVMPGVGNLHAIMEHLEAQRWPEHVKGYAASGRPLLGVCVGMQVLAERGTEGGSTDALGLVPGLVDRLPEGDGIRLPHVGWSTVTFRRQHPVFEGVKNNRDFYFVHSYGIRAEQDESCLAETTHGCAFASVVGRGNVVGFQFHPEKSHANGLKLLENFCRWDGRC